MATAASSKAADSYIGSLICLITKSDIRYEGFLFHLDPQESTIGLRNVKSFGTEGRKKDGPQISPSDKIYEYIFFRGSDMKDLQVISSPPPQSTSAVPDDPAIIQSHFPNPTPTGVGLTSHGAAQVANVNTSAPSILPVAPFQMNLPQNPSAPSTSLWGSPLPPPPVNINAPAVPTYWPGLIGSSGGVSHFQQQRFPPPPQSLIASRPNQQQGQHQNVNASLAGGSSFVEQHPPLLLPISTASPNLLPPVPYASSGQSNQGHFATLVSNLSAMPIHNNAPSALPIPATDSGLKMVSPLADELNFNAVLAPVTKEPSPIISTSDSFPSISQTALSIVDSTGASVSKLSRLSPLTPEGQSGVKEPSSSQSLQSTNFDVRNVQASVSEPLPSESAEETLEPLPKSTTKTLHGSTSSHHNRSHFAGGRDWAHRDTLSTYHSNRGHTQIGNAPNGAAIYTHQSHRKHSSGTGNELIGAALHSHQSNMSMGRGRVPNGVHPLNHRNMGSHFRGRGAKNSHGVTRFSEDFDFEAMNEKFNKKEVWDFLGKSSKAESDDGSVDEKEMDDSDAQGEAGDGHVKHDYKPVYCKDDFFDSLSCHALYRESGKVKFSEQRKKDAETFGEIQKHQRGRGQGVRMSGPSQGSYRGRGHDHVRGGRSHGRTVWGRVT